MTYYENPNNPNNPRIESRIGRAREKFEYRLRAVLLFPIIYILTYRFIDYQALLGEMFGMAFGKIPQPANFTPMTAVLTIGELSVIDLALALLVVIPGFLIYRTSVEFKATPKRQEPLAIPLGRVKGVILLEENLARLLLFGLPLYLLKAFLAIDSIFAFYFFWLLSNGVWALLHLTNYKTGHKHILMVLPQLFSGLFVLTYLYLTIGFWASYAAHLLFDLILFAIIGKAETRTSMIRNFPRRLIGWTLGIFLIALTSPKITLSIDGIAAMITATPYMQWLQGDFTTASFSAIAFAGFVLITVDSIGFILDIAGLDESKYKPSYDNAKPGVARFFMAFENFIDTRKGRLAMAFIRTGVVVTVIPVAYYAANWVVLMLSAPLSIQGITTATLLLASFVLTLPSSKSSSPSAEIRDFITQFPMFFLLFAAFASVTWWQFAAAAFFTYFASAILGIFKSKKGTS